MRRPSSGLQFEIWRKKGQFPILWLAVSPDENTILFNQEPSWVAELIVIENSR